ncbi:hypothetical protein D9Q81_08570 [Candidatus Korarchaeum cryptofilum]|uniref:Uncharacterized protein n=1 Tax=Candidatus Korarchaeum cryptofilum TaxID=498846 RepID=A0A3R9Q7Y7_9CREN|nr:hypothetical protein [Candidatus Korarchaeum cryptofilum]RSN67373.1 hypothetical protein D9Q81_08570 [Candidatus Korarchaeum cryptofilum]
MYTIGPYIWGFSFNGFSSITENSPADMNHYTGLRARESSKDTELYVLAIAGVLSVVLGLGVVDHLVLLLS